MGLVQSIFRQFYPPPPTWSPNEIPDLTGQVVIVTGGNAGLGKATVKELLKHNAKVYIAARNHKSSEETIEELRLQTGKEALFLHLDLADLYSVKTCAEEFLSKETQLHVLYNNAGVMEPPFETLTKQGFDLQFGVNVLGHFYLTKLLLPALLSTAKTSTDEHARVVNISSFAHVYFPFLNFNSFRDSPTRRKFGFIPSMLYSQSKFGNVVFAKELARRYGEQGIVSTSVHPGAIDTALWTAGAMPWIIVFIARLFVLQSLEYAAYTQLYAGTAPETAEMNGQYFIPWARLGEAHRKSEDAVLGKQLWEYMDEQVKNIELIDTYIP
ncbi:NAD(P)-binding protein [Marasmius fiardii PR-910]|nr:NAD(P)-binding protein [Marasmius fiardii PR-910]